MQTMLYAHFYLNKYDLKCTTFLYIRIWGFSYSTIYLFIFKYTTAVDLGVFSLSEAQLKATENIHFLFSLKIVGAPTT